MFRCPSLISQIASYSLKGRSAIINAALIDPTKAEATEATTMLSRGFSISLLRQATVSLKESGKSSVNKSDESPEPKKPRSPYVIFLSDEYKSERTKNPELKKLGDISKVLAERWKNLSKDQKSSYEARFQHDKNEYSKKYEEWQNSLTLEDIELENQHRGLKNKKLLKDPNLPKKPVTSYIHFVKQNLNVNDGESSTSRLSKLAEKWKSLSEEETEPYKNLAEKDKERYSKEIAEYNNKGKKSKS
nr:904_t:CDS:2 [Entrophospora candida]